MVGRRLATRGDFGFGVIRPVLEAGGKPCASGLGVVPHDSVFHGGRPQIRVVDVVHRAVGDVLAFYPCCPGRRRKKGVLLRRTDRSEAGHHKAGYQQKEEI